ncbi:hypothetical protein Poli38472_000488 [Pythium oligandrum]|uniref:Uncharacterized protein n=1 Tax=Pythium oligandrum TaxID=41045 RepID=A0A8K1CCK6_PYTOL|nr:hypothetical protein Poli38472_000488 [Pythium oligandrum]|eukprot:TMW60446.1 hypothetical protein Poli38472_000488 [Pythium oligandrum]
MTVAVQGSTSVLGKRLAQDMTTHFEDALTEYYRQECLRSLYKTARPRILTPRAAPVAPEPTKRKRVTLSLVPQIIGSADPLVDRSPIDVTPISQLEMVVLLSQRTFPAQS